MSLLALTMMPAPISIPTVSFYNIYCTGYGHGYTRFATMISTLNQHRTQAGDLAVLRDEEEMNLLSDITRDSNSADKISGTYGLFHLSIRKRQSIYVS